MKVTNFICCLFWCFFFVSLFLAMFSLKQHYGESISFSGCVNQIFQIQSEAMVSGCKALTRLKWQDLADTVVDAKDASSRHTHTHTPLHYPLNPTTDKYLIWFILTFTKSYRRQICPQCLFLSLCLASHIIQILSCWATSQWAYDGCEASQKHPMKLISISLE